MDTLQRLVMDAAADAADSGDDPRTTFYRIQSLVYAVASGRTPARMPHRHAPPRQRPPKLTETWFC
jgi:hypothetical protein